MKLEKAVLPKQYDTYIFDLYGTLVDIHTDEGSKELWEKLALFLGYYNARYEAQELREFYGAQVAKRERALKKSLDGDPKYVHESSPEIDIVDVFGAIYTEKGVQPSEELVIHTGQFFRVLSTEYVRTYPGTAEMLGALKKAGKKVYLLSNAQRIFTEYEMHTLDIARYFDDILISSDHQTKKPDERFFRVLLERHDIDVSQAIFVGNDSRTDIAGARQVGLATFYVRSNISPDGDRAPLADYQVDEFEAWEI